MVRACGRRGAVDDGAFRDGRKSSSSWPGRHQRLDPSASVRSAFQISQNELVTHQWVAESAFVLGESWK